MHRLQSPLKGEGGQPAQRLKHQAQSSGGTVIKPLVGEQGVGPSDAAVVTPVDGSSRGIAIANGLATGLSDDPYVMTLAAIETLTGGILSSRLTAADLDMQTFYGGSAAGYTDYPFLEV